MIEYDVDAYNRKWKGTLAPLQVYPPGKKYPGGVVYKYIAKIHYVDGEGLFLVDPKDCTYKLWNGKPSSYETYDPLYMHIPPRIYESNIGAVAVVRRNTKSFKLGLSSETHFIFPIVIESEKFRWESLVFDKKATPTGNKEAKSGVIDDRCWWKNGKVYNLATNIGLLNSAGEVYLNSKELIPYYQRKWGESWTILPQ